MSSPASIENNRRLSREAKRRRTGTCVDCGTTTRYNGHGHSVSERCPRCANRVRGIAKRGSGATQARVLEVLARGPARYVEICDQAGVPRHSMGQLLGRLRRNGLIVRLSRGVYQLPEPPA